MDAARRRALPPRCAPTGSGSWTRPPDQRVVTPLHVGGHPCEEPLARSRSRPCPPSRCSPQVAAAATAATPRPRRLPAKTGGEITVRGCNPENPLIPSNTTETCGGTVIDAVFSKLVHYDPETAAPQERHRRVDRDDGQPDFTVKLKQGYKFHDGTEVKAKNFVDAWNYAAYAPNAQSSGYFMEPIEGFADLQCAGTANPDDPCEGHAQGQGR